MALEEIVQGIGKHGKTILWATGLAILLGTTTYQIAKKNYPVAGMTSIGAVYLTGRYIRSIPREE
jgi:hypothetical protein